MLVNLFELEHIGVLVFESGNRLNGAYRAKKSSFLPKTKQTFQQQLHGYSFKTSFALDKKASSFSLGQPHPNSV